MSELSHAEQVPRPLPKECKGPITYSGALFHGRSQTPEQSEHEIDVYMDYRNYFIRDSTNPVVSRLLGDLGSLTLGPALYTTFDQEEAEKYAHQRAAGTELPFLHTLQVENMRLYDFRTPDGSRNAFVPLDVAQRWRTYYEANKHLIEERFRQFGEDGVKNFEMWEKSRLDSYSDFLEEFLDRLKKGEIFRPPPRDFRLRMHDERYKTDQEIVYEKTRGLDLRDMLRTQAGDPGWTAPTFGGLWASFVVDELQSEGIVVNEGGDAAHFKESPTIAIYKLDPTFVSSQKVAKLTNPT